MATTTNISQPKNGDDEGTTTAITTAPSSHILLRDSTDPTTFHTAVWGRVFNCRRDTSRVPSAVVHATSVAHVKEAIDLAGSLGSSCRVSVRSGGHSWAAWSVRHDAVLLDLVGLRHLSYDEEMGVVKCSPAVTGEEINEFLKKKGRMFAGGHCPDVGLGGFLLQGGMGWNAKNWGWACESMVGIDAATADGRELYCSTTENSDLFWAARGAGPGFPAIVTKFHLLTRPLLQLFNTIFIYPASQFSAVLQWIIDICPTADPDTEVVCLGKHAPDNSGEINIIAVFLTFKPSRAEAETAMHSIINDASRPRGAKAEIICVPTDLADQYATQRAEQPPGNCIRTDNVYIANEEKDVPAVLEPGFTTLPTKKSFALYVALNPVSRRQPAEDMALSLQSDHYFSVYTMWDNDGKEGGSEGEEARKCDAWVSDIMARAERHSIGSYLGDADFRMRAATRFWSQDAGQRLSEVRRRWDPEGRICGYLDAEDTSGVQGLRNEFGWVGDKKGDEVGEGGE